MHTLRVQVLCHKKNPDVAELVRGKTGRVYGNQMALLTMMKGIPLAYNKDMQEDKELIFDSIDTVKVCLSTFSKMVDTLTVKKENMKKACKEGFINATDLADYLVKKNIAFRDAHKILGEMVLYCIENKKHLEDLSLKELKSFSEAFTEDAYEVLNIVNCVENRDVIGGPSSKQVMIRLKELKDYITKKEIDEE